MVGGGSVAERRIQGLLGQGADIRVITAAATDVIAELAKSKQVALYLKRYEEADLEGAFMVIAATNDARVNSAVTRMATDRDLLVCCTDDPTRGNYITPAVIYRGDLMIAIATGGENATLSSVLKERLEAEFGPEWKLWPRLFGQLRPIIQALPTKSIRSEAVRRVLENKDIETLLKSSRLEDAVAAARKCI